MVQVTVRRPISNVAAEVQMVIPQKPKIMNPCKFEGKLSISLLASIKVRDVDMWHRCRLVFCQLKSKTQWQRCPFSN